MHAASVLDLIADIFKNVILQLCGMLKSVGLAKVVVTGLADLHSCILVANVTHPISLPEKGNVRRSS